jgi:hypothetical protein
MQDQLCRFETFGPLDTVPLPQRPLQSSSSAGDWLRLMHRKRSKSFVEAELF